MIDTCPVCFKSLSYYKLDESYDDRIDLITCDGDSHFDWYPRNHYISMEHNQMWIRFSFDGIMIRDWSNDDEYSFRIVLSSYDDLVNIIHKAFNRQLQQDMIFL